MSPTPLLRPLVLAVCVLGLPSAAALDGPRGRESRPRTPERAPARPAVRSGLLESLPVSFEENRGQGEEGAAFLGRGNGFTVAISGAEAVFHLGGGTESRIGMRLRGARRGSSVRGMDILPTRSNFFLGNDPDRWITGVPHYAGLRASGALPGVDLVWRGEPGGRVRYDLELAAGLDPASVTFHFEGADSILAAPDGGLEIRAPGVRMRHSRPVAWQEAAGRRRTVDCRYEVRGKSARFVAVDRDPNLPLVIDPIVTVSHVFGTGNNTWAQAAGIDSSASVLLAGKTVVGGQGTTGAYQPNLAGSDDVFVVKFPEGSSTPTWFTYLGGNNQDWGQGLALDAKDDIYVAGVTTSTTLPVVKAVQNSNQGDFDAFAAKIGAAGSTLEYCTYFGGSGYDWGLCVAVTPGGSAWVGGWTDSPAIPLADALDSSRAGYDGFVFRLAADMPGLEFSTYLGGDDDDFLYGVAVDEDQRAWVTGMTNSPTFPVQDAVQPTKGGKFDVFLAGIDPAGPSLLYSSFIGGSENDYGFAVDTDLAGDVFVTGTTISADFPVESALQGTHGGGGDVLVYKLDSTSETTVFSTYLGGDAQDEGYAIAVDPDGHPVVAGFTHSSNFPTKDPTDSTWNGSDDAFLSHVDGDGSSLRFSTYLGSTGDAMANGVAVDGSVAAVAGVQRGQVGGQPHGALWCVQILPSPFGNFRTTSVRGDAVALAWSDPHDGAYAVELQRRAPGGDFATIAALSAGVTEHEDLDVVEATAYEYRVRGTSADGNTGWSPNLFVQNGVLAPGNVAVTSVENDEVRFTWEDRTGSEIGYAILRKPGGAPGDLTIVTQLPPGSTSGSDTTVDPETSYEFRVRAQGPAGRDGDSVAIPIRTPPATPGAFGVLAIDDASVQLTWSDESSAETGYEIQRRDDGAGGAFTAVSTGPPGLESYLDEGVAAEHAYTWRVRAFNADGGSRWTNEVSLTTPPAAPTGLLAAAPTAEAVDVSWTDASQAEFLYRIERKGPGQLAFSAHGQVPANQISFRDDQVLQKTSYSYRVRATSSWGASRALETVEVETPAQLVILKAAHRPARGDRPARISATGRLDPGAEAIDWNAGGRIRIGGSVHDVPAWTFSKGAYRFEADGFRVQLKAAKKGSELLLAVTEEGAAAEAVGPDGRLDLEVALGGFRAVGNAMLSEGRFDPAKGRGRWVTPSLTVTSMSAATPPGKPHRVKIAAAFAPPQNPLDLIADVRITIGPSFQAVLESNAFVFRKGKFILHTESGPVWDAVLDPVRGTLKVRGANIGLGSIPEGTFPFRIELDVGDFRYADDPVVVSTGRSLKY